MKWRIKNPAPQDSRQEKWGDFHFGRSLTKYLTRLGQEVVTDYDGDWDKSYDEDVVLVLRGKYSHKVKKGPINVIWNISHPADVAIEEYNDYDLVFVASDSYTNKLKGQIDKPVFSLLQCTDIEEFGAKEGDIHERKDFIFVGNTRSVERPGVIWSTELGVPLKVWGRGWKEYIPKKYVVEQYIDNTQLGDLYSSAKVIVNDHWEDMKEYGFINNRIFDAISCGTPVISDYHEELYKLFPNEILYYRNKADLESCYREILLNYDAVARKVFEKREMISNQFSFEKRAELILNKISEFKQ